MLIYRIIMVMRRRTGRAAYFDPMLIADLLSVRWGIPLPDKLPKAAPQPAPLKKKKGDAATLKRLMKQSRDKDKLAAAADELGAMAGTLNDVDALGLVLRCCADKEAVAIATHKLLGRLDEVQDIPVLKAMILHTEDSEVVESVVGKLSPMVYELNDSLLLIYIASWANARKARLAAVERLKGDMDSLRQVSLHSRHEDSKEKARRLLDESGVE
jgi:hypothetical protein